MTDITFPDLGIDFTPNKIEEGDDLEYIEKINNILDLLMLLQLRQQEAWAVQIAYLEAARNLPDDYRQHFETLVAEAKASEEGMRNILASVNWPELPDSPAGYMFRVNASGTGYEAVPPSVLTESIAQDALSNLESVLQQISAIRDQWNVSDMPAGSLARVVVDPTTSERSFEAVSFATLHAEMHNSAVVADPGEDQTATINLPDNPIDGMTVSLIFEFCPCDRVVIVNAGTVGEIYGGYASMTLDITSRSIRLMYKNNFWRAA